MIFGVQGSHSSIPPHHRLSPIGVYCIGQKCCVGLGLEVIVGEHKKIFQISHLEHPMSVKKILARNQRNNYHVLATEA